MRAMQAIRTRYLGPTDKRGSRISATAAAGRAFIDYPHELPMEERHRAAAAELCKRYGWDASELVEGVLSNQDHVFVFVEGK